MNNLLKWIGTSFTALSAIIIAIEPSIALTWTPFVGYGIGAIIWLYAAIKDKEWALAALNLLFVIVDLYAISIRL